MTTGLPDAGEPPVSPGLVVVRRLHRLVRHGYVPLLGHAPASGEDRAVELHRKGARATIRPDGSVRLASSAAPGDTPGDALDDRATVLDADDARGFDALFPPDAPNRRNLVRRLYEMGIGSR